MGCPVPARSVGDDAAAKHVKRETLGAEERRRRHVGVRGGNGAAFATRGPVPKQTWPLNMSDGRQTHAGALKDALAVV